MHHNPFVAYLNRYTTVSADHEAAFDEFVTELPLDGFGRLSLNTTVKGFIDAAFQRARPPSIILTGNAGDGKTYLCRQIVQMFRAELPADWNTKSDIVISNGRQKLHVIKDFSELEERRGRELLGDIARQFADPSPDTLFLIAANEGRLREALKTAEPGDGALQELARQIEAQLEQGPDAANQALVVINLNRVATSSFVPQALDWITNPAHWEACAAEAEPCPIHHNAQRLAEPAIGERVRFLYRILEHLGIHVTIRDMLIHLAYTVTGGKQCAAFSALSGADRLRKASDNAYYENIIGEHAEELFRQKSAVIRHLRRLSLGANSYLSIDNMIVYASEDAAHSDAGVLASPQLDLGETLFHQARAQYLRAGAAISEDTSEASERFLRWLPHCRRKLFFEHPDAHLANRLFSFLYLPQYFALLDGDRALINSCQKRLILGLNRAFTGLYLANVTEGPALATSHLYLTSQYSKGVEQPIPIIQAKIPADNIVIERDQTSGQVIDQEEYALYLEIYPPARVRAEPVRWPLDLLKFEYLMRRAAGGTPDMLANECQLAIQRLKQQLLSSFAQQSTGGELAFFAPADASYTIYTLALDIEGSEAAR